MLVGRREETLRFRRLVDDHPVVLLHGPSGVGKSSLIRAGLIPQLEKAGRVVAHCDDWSRAGSSKTGDFLAQKLHPNFADVDDPPSPDGSLFLWMHERYGGNLVMILDQFEELIRYSPAMAERINEAILRLNAHYDLSLVLSFRSEYLFEMKDLTDRLPTYDLTTFAVKEIEDSFAEELIEKGREKIPDVIDKEAKKAILAKWKEERQPAPRRAAGDLFGQVGLLHLQGVLYSLQADSEDGTVTEEQVTELAGSPDGLFGGGLIESVRIKVERCFRVASQGVPSDSDSSGAIDPWLRLGTRRMVAHIAGHLSSAGYKLVREAEELMGAVFREDLDRLRVGVAEAGQDPARGTSGDGLLREASDERPGQLEHLIWSLLKLATGSVPGDQGDEKRVPEEEDVDLLGSTVSDLAAWVDDQRNAEEPKPGASDELPWSDRLHPGEEPWVADPKDVTCGAAMGSAPAAVLIEEVRRYAFALACLRESAMVRTSSSDGRSTNISLIHDGFGRALEIWADRELEDPDLELYRITAPTGASYFWKTPDTRGRLAGDAEEPRILANLRWRGTWVSAEFRHVTFVNCDFRGSFFESCSFEGVTMLNCQLDGAIFSDCIMEGEADWYAGSWEPNLPWFHIDADVPETLLQALIRYGSAPETAPTEVLLSPDPGRPARPGTKAMANDTWDREKGGLVIYGGRVSSLVFRGTRVREDSLLAFRDVAGSGLDIVEHGGGRYEFHGCALRHVVITDDADDSTFGPYEISSIGSQLVQVWIGDGVHGTWIAADCHLVHVHNGSQLEFDATDPLNKYLDLHGVTLDPRCEELTLDRETLDDYALVMDYQRNPAKVAAMHERGQ